MGFGGGSSTPEKKRAKLTVRDDDPVGIQQRPRLPIADRQTQADALLTPEEQQRKSLTG